MKEVKKCPKCKLMKPIEKFSKKYYGYYYHSYCSDCKEMLMERWGKKYPLLAAYLKNGYNPEKQRIERASREKKYDLDPDVNRDRVNAFNHKDPEEARRRQRLYTKRYRERHLEERRRAQRIYSKRNRDKMLELKQNKLKEVV